MSRLLILVMLLVYLAFASQLIRLWRAGQYGQFFLRLLLAPVILLFDWPIRRTQWKQPP